MNEDDSSRVLAYLGNSSQVAVQWMPPVGRVSDDGAIFYSNQWIRTFLGERILELATYIDYRVLRGEVDTFRVQLCPKGTRSAYRWRVRTSVSGAPTDQGVL